MAAQLSARLQACTPTRLRPAAQVRASSEEGKARVTEGPQQARRSSSSRWACLGGNGSAVVGCGGCRLEGSASSNSKQPLQSGSVAAA